MFFQGGACKDVGSTESVAVPSRFNLDEDRRAPRQGGKGRVAKAVSELANQPSRVFLDAPTMKRRGGSDLLLKYLALRAAAPGTTAATASSTRAYEYNADSQFPAACLRQCSPSGSLGLGLRSRNSDKPD